MPDASAWFRFRRVDGDLAPARLFCFPFAGGGASTYRGWADRLMPHADVIPVQLPGREERFREPAFTRMGALCATLTGILEPLLDRPFAFFGHSMGALVAFELARIMEARGKSLAQLFVSGQRGPQIPLRRPISYNLPEEAFLARLRELAGTPDAVLRDAEMMSLFSPLLRSDFELNETYPRRQHPPLSCPIVVLGGTNDAEVSREDLEAWRSATAGPFRLETFPGGHFFVQSSMAQVSALVAQTLNALSPETGQKAQN